MTSKGRLNLSWIIFFCDHVEISHCCFFVVIADTDDDDDYDYDYDAAAVVAAADNKQYTTGHGNTYYSISMQDCVVTKADDLSLYAEHSS